MLRPRPALKSTPRIKNASWVIVICAIIAVCLFIFWFGNDMHFDEDGHPRTFGALYTKAVSSCLYCRPSSSPLSFSP